MDELKPCPFCGGEAKVMRSRLGYKVFCDTPFCCWIGTCHTWHEAIAAWNQRAERTCKPIDEYCCGVPSCGNCGVTLNMVTSGVRPFNQVLPNYCPNCGSKVVE